MQISWWETGINIEPETPEETEALKIIWNNLRIAHGSNGERKKPGSGKHLSSSGICPDDSSELVIANQ
jgi:hypothetical protein